MLRESDDMLRSDAVFARRRAGLMRRWSPIVAKRNTVVHGTRAFVAQSSSVRWSRCRADNEIFIRAVAIPPLYLFHEPGKLNSTPHGESLCGENARAEIVNSATTKSLVRAACHTRGSCAEATAEGGTPDTALPSPWLPKRRPLTGSHPRSGASLFCRPATCPSLDGRETGRPSRIRPPITGGEK